MNNAPRPMAHTAPAASTRRDADLQDGDGHLAESMTSFPATKPTYLTAQLRESVPYLRDAGWRETATLLVAAADEIEQLGARVVDLECRFPAPKRPQLRSNDGGEVVRDLVKL